jgi:hypothetical protein
MRRRSGLLFICLALVAACGGGNAIVTTSEGAGGLPSSTVTTTSAQSSTTTTQGQSTTTTEADEGNFLANDAVLAASDALAAQLGDEEASIAVVLALNHGYSYGQLMDAAVAGTLQADGTITGVDPEYDAYGLIAGNANALATGAVRAVPAVWVTPVAAAGYRVPSDADILVKEAGNDLEVILESPLFTEWEREREERARRERERTASAAGVMIMMLHLSSLGYSFEQIVTGIVLGEFTMLRSGRWEESHCFGLSEKTSDGSLRAITPALPPSEDLSGGCTDLTEQFGAGEDGAIQARTRSSGGWFDVTATGTSTTTMPDAVTELRAEGVFDMPVTDDVTIIANSVALVIVDTEVTFDAFDWTWSYRHSAPADCIKTGNMRLLGSDVTFDPATERFQGTVTANDTSDDEGAACPFGGGHRDVDRMGVVEGTLENGTVTMTISFPTIPEAFETTLIVAAEVS